MHSATTIPTSQKAKKVDINIAHLCLGNISERALQHLAKKYGWELTGKFNRCCDACAYAKGKQKNVKKTTAKSASKPCERLFVDLSGPFHPTNKSNKYWFMAVDDYSRKKWSRYIKSKDQIGIPLEELLITMKGRGTPVKYLRCDNAGENTVYVKDLCNKYGIQPEFKAPNTPQQNGVVKRSFATVKAKACEEVLVWLFLSGCALFVILFYFDLT